MECALGLSQTRTMRPARGHASSESHHRVSARPARVLVGAARAWRSHSSGAKHTSTSATPLRTHPWSRRTGPRGQGPARVGDELARAPAGAHDGAGGAPTRGEAAGEAAGRLGHAPLPHPPGGLASSSSGGSRSWRGTPTRRTRARRPCPRAAGPSSGRAPPARPCARGR